MEPCRTGGVNVGVPRDPQETTSRGGGTIENLDAYAAHYRRWMQEKAHP